MSRATWEVEIERCYGTFDQQHDTLRDRLQVDLRARIADDHWSDVAVDEMELVSPALRRVAGLTTRRRGVWPLGLALAACLFVAALGWNWLPVGGPAPAFGLEDLPRRLQNLRSIYLRGTSYYGKATDQGVERLAARSEMYVERPGRYYRLTPHYTNATGVREQKRTLSDGTQHLAIDDNAKTAVIGKEQPQAAEYTVETLMQGSIPQQLLGGPTAAGYRKVRSELLSGIQADVYERIFQYPERPNRSRRVVWLNPATGMPIRVEHFSKFGDKPEELIHVTEHIEINGAPPAEALNLTPPEGYAVEHVDVPREKIGSEMSGGVSSVGSKQQAWHALRFCFNIGDRAALVCWARYNDLSWHRESELEGPVGRKIDLSPTSSLGDRTFANYFLRVDKTPKFHWHWSLVVPSGDKHTLGDGDLVFTIIEDDGYLCRGTLIGKPLTFERDELARWIVTAQRLTMPENAPEDAVFTLEQIEGLIDKFRASE